MKKLYFFLGAILISYTNYAQYSKNYKELAKQQNANFYEISNNTRKEFTDIKNRANGKVSLAERKAKKHFERWAKKWDTKIYNDGTFPKENLGFFNAGILTPEGKISSKSSTNKRSENSWTNIGPDQSQVNNNGYVSYPQMGRLNAFLRIPHPSDRSKDILFVGAPNGGIWKSEDGGENWTPKCDYVATIGAYDIETVPGTTTENYMNRPIYVSTGDYDGSDSNSIGVLKSIDGGETFESTGLSYKIDEEVLLGDLVVTDKNTVFVGEGKTIKKTTDGGNSWKVVCTSDLDTKIGRASVFNNEVIFTGDKADIYYTSDYNNDSSWEKHTVTTTMKWSKERMAITHSKNGNAYVQKNDGQIYKFNRSGSFERIGRSVTGYNSQSGYNQALIVDDGLIISGEMEGRSSSDNGSSWEKTLNGYYDGVTNTSGNYIHSDHHRMGRLNNDMEFWSVNDGGLSYIKFNDSKDVKPIITYKSGAVKVTQCYSVSINPSANDKAMIIANQDNDAFSQRNGKWHSIYLGDGVQSAINYNNSDLRYAVNQNGVIKRSNTGFEGQLNGMDKERYIIPSVSFDFPLEMHTTDPTILYAGGSSTANGKGLYIIKDNGNSLSIDKASSTLERVYSLSTHGNSVIIGDSNFLEKSTDNGNTWTKITAPRQGGKITSVDFDGNNNNTIYITKASYYDGEKVFKSTDGGSTWKNISGDLPNIVVYEVILKQNQASEELFLATEIGVYQSTDKGNTWTKLGDNLPNVTVRDLDIHYTNNKLVAATFGRGLWEISIGENNLSTNDFETIDSKINIFPNPASNVINITNNEKGNFNYIIYNAVGGVIKRGNVSNSPINVSNLAKGVYMIRIFNKLKSTTKKIIIK